jgi:hypothetical protein
VHMRCANGYRERTRSTRRQIAIASIAKRADRVRQG